jgi:D-glucosaminate-6-phosphate ammonia-lyase
VSLFERFGCHPLINAAGAVTRLGGAPMHPAALQAYQQAALEDVALEELQAAASKRIAGWTGAEAALVTSGAAASLTLASAAVLAGNDAAKMEQLPFTEGIPNEIVIAREQRSGYDHALRAAGARLREVGFDEVSCGAGIRRVETWEYGAAIGPNTVAMAYTLTRESCPPLAEVVACAHEHDLPVIVDASSQLPPREQLRTIPQSGADLVCFSGGKALRGPQATGILCGRRALIQSAAVQMLDMDVASELWAPPRDFIDPQALSGLPRHGIGRGFKVAKESIAALLAAIEAFLAEPLDEDLARHSALLDRVEGALGKTQVGCRRVAGAAETPPTLELRIDPAMYPGGATAAYRALVARTPAVYLGCGKLREGLLIVHSGCVREAQADALVESLCAVFRSP